MNTQPVRIIYQFDPLMVLYDFDMIPKPRTFAIYSKSGFYTKFSFVTALSEEFAAFLFKAEHGKYQKIVSVTECDFKIN